MPIRLLNVLQPNNNHRKENKSITKRTYRCSPMEEIIHIVLYIYKTLCDGCCWKYHGHDHDMSQHIETHNPRTLSLYIPGARVLERTVYVSARRTDGGERVYRATCWNQSGSKEVSIYLIRCSENGSTTSHKGNHRVELAPSTNSVLCCAIQ